MKRALFGILAAGAIIAGALVTLIPVDVKDLRVAILEGTCPEERLETCEGGMVKAGTNCLCYTTTTSSLPLEVTAITAPNMKRKLIVCRETDAESKQEVLRVRRIPQTDIVPVECQVVAQDILLDASTGVPGTLEAQLAEACSPCEVTPKSWGPCPYCLLEPGGCSAACK